MIIDFLADISPVFNFVLACAAVVSSVLLIINAILIFLYFWETKRLAKESEKQTKLTNKLVAISRKDFEPNVQITLKEHTADVLSCGNLTGLLFYKERAFLIECDLANISKGTSEFWIEFDTSNCYILTNASKSFIIPFDDNGNIDFHFILRPKEQCETNIFFKETGEEVGRENAKDNGLKVVQIVISYIIKYRNCRELFDETWSMRFGDIIRIDSEHFVFEGEWSNVERRYTNHADNC